MAEKKDRFERIYKEGVFGGDGFEIWVDIETGVNYVWRQFGNAGGLTPLLDREGKPVITALEK